MKSEALQLQKRVLMDNFIVITIAATAAALYIAAIAYAVVQINKTRQLNNLEKLVWTLGVLLAPVVGGILWYVAGPHPFGIRLNRDPR